MHAMFSDVVIYLFQYNFLMGLFDFFAFYSHKSKRLLDVFPMLKPAQVLYLTVTDNPTS